MTSWPNAPSCVASMGSDPSDPKRARWLSFAIAKSFLPLSVYWSIVSLSAVRRGMLAIWPNGGRWADLLLLLVCYGASTLILPRVARSPIRPREMLVVLSRIAAFSLALAVGGITLSSWLLCRAAPRGEMQTACHLTVAWLGIWWAVPAGALVESHLGSSGRT